MKLFDYEKYLESLGSFKIEFGLDRVKTLLARLDNPQDKFPTFHVAGTNGKGSVAVMAANMLAASGYKVGLYTSPHLVDIRERLAIFTPYAHQPKCVPAQVFSRLIRRIRETSQEKPAVKLTYFEVITAAAFLFFAEEKIDIAVLEVGMGGRLDATNVVTPCLSVITPIAFDHREWLGSTLAKIAKEKVGIIKEGIPCVSAAQEKAAWKVIKKTCLQKSAPLFKIRVASRVQKRKILLKPIEKTRLFETVSLKAGTHSYKNFRTRLLGRHQAENAALALAAVDKLRKMFPGITSSAVKRGLAHARWPGRFEMIGKKPLLIIDGAHNAHACRSLAANIRRFLKGRNIYLITAILDDKDAGDMCRILMPWVTRVVIVDLKIPRFRKVKRLVKIVKSYGLPVDVSNSFADAFEKQKAALKNPSTDVILAAGSLYLAGMALAHKKS